MYSGAVRATALPAEERRAALVAATLPLLLEHGSSVTTRQIAEAAGIAEGTIFRVFPDKDSLIEAAIAAAFDPAALVAQLDAIDRSLPLEPRLELAVELLQHRIGRIFRLMSTVGASKPGEGKLAVPATPPPELTSLAALFEPDRAILRRDPLAAAQLLRGLAFAGSHPMFTTAGPWSPSEIVSLALDGIRIPNATSGTARPRTTRPDAAHPEAAHPEAAHQRTAQESEC